MAAAPNGRQFTLLYLFAITAIVALSLALVVRWGAWVLLAVWIGGIGLSLFQKRYVIAGGLFGLLLIWVLLLPTIGTAKPAARRAQCINQMKQITLAILNYERTHGHLPPPYTTDDEGNPLHSWRVLILPFVEEQDLYDAIDLTKPWHHPHNLALQAQMPYLYQCPSVQPDHHDVTTAYVAILGKHTAWPRSGKRTMDDITDGPSKTLALLESEKHRVHWMSTADPGIEMIGPLNAAGETLVSSSNHNGGVVYSRCDASVGFLASDTDLSYLRSLITVDRGDNSP